MKWFLVGALGMLMLMLIIPMESGSAAGDTKEVAPLFKPNSEMMKQKAPEVYKARFETTRGDFIIEVHRKWAPHGADRFYNLVRNDFYNECRFFRVIENFMAQIGISGDPKLAAVWRSAQIADDPVVRSNTGGYVSFATAGPNTRTTQFFINYKDNSRLDSSGFSPFGKVIEGMKEVVDSLYSGYGEGAPRGKGPDQGRIQREGNAYLQKEFAKLDYVKTATILKQETATPEK